MRVWLAGTVVCVACARAEPPPAQGSGLPVARGAALVAPDTGGASFDAIGDVWSLASGGAVVFLPRQGRFLVFDRAGALTRTIARPGAGPGELGIADVAGLRGDTLWAYEDPSRRLQRWTLDGRVVDARSLTLIAPGWESAGGVRALLADGSLLVQQQLNWSAMARGQLPPQSRVARFDPTGRRAVEGLPTLDLSRLPLNGTSPTGAGVLGVQPFEAPPLLVAAPAGGFYAYVLPSEDGVAVHVRRPDGTVVLDRVVSLQGPRLEGARLDSARAGLDAPMLALPPSVLRIPERLPAYARAVLSDSGEVWLRLDAPLLHRAHEEWLVVSTARERRVTLPSGVALLRPEGGGFWGVQAADDAPRLQAYRLTP